MFGKLGGYLFMIQHELRDSELLITISGQLLSKDYAAIMPVLEDTSVSNIVIDCLRATLPDEFTIKSLNMMQRSLSNGQKITIKGACDHSKLRFIKGLSSEIRLL